MRVMLDNELKSIHVDIIKMGTLIEKTIDETINALVDHDIEMARRIIEGDDRFDKMELEIESKCINVIARRQPVATDLRKLMSILKIVTDLERIADHCQDISKLTIDLAGKTYVKPLIDLPNMAKQVKSMVKMTIDCYIDEDVEKGKLICANDDIVDDYYDMIFADLENIMKENPKEIRQCMDFMMIAKYFERMADHATNIAEWVIYGVEGKHFDINETI
ncbi:phosphate signaling complex protein PhoU [Fusibacter ferrireducens]|uniref:Phosphate-specific transport system accessory protein PhoU n=1 Tax=Fusibacter ferrireducens TaxID=2785058 RepID=A0ABR9ZUC9_9FIRM|nr:phosphate signaling complex protein PhoU [Fusibacter ferrireducens]MBF4694043.1 phosphate signaling complex protein PhoU [Fusibacter ferrireducens]